MNPAEAYVLVLFRFQPVKCRYVLPLAAGSNLGYHNSIRMNAADLGVAFFALNLKSGALLRLSGYCESLGYVARNSGVGAPIPTQRRHLVLIQFVYAASLSTRILFIVRFNACSALQRS